MPCPGPRTLTFLLLAGAGSLCPGWAVAADPVLPAEDLAFFENRVRPILAEHCLDCHSAGTKTKGGLALDSAQGWHDGGESGPAVVPGDVEGSLLIKAVRYAERGLQMPPKNRLTPAEVAILEEWVSRGAPDPRGEAAGAGPKHQVGLSLAEGRRFWSYLPPLATPPPAVADPNWADNDVDRFLLARLETAGLAPAGDAEPAALVRRLYLDLTGLPPTPEQIDQWLADPSATAWEVLVDRLLESPRFGEHWGRHWLDVVRYGESLTLRGLVFTEAWRYRDYVIDAFNRDLPYDQLLREHVAGDLLPAESPQEKQRQTLGTAFLVLGNHNMEEQDKAQLNMDIVDEQLDTIGKAFLGQTLGCARCHDHKFDPIPTKDYYAMAGILRSVNSAKHANVSKWVEVDLPLPEALAARYEANDAAIAALETRVKKDREALNALRETLDPATKTKPRVLNLAALPGITLDDGDAKLIGNWTTSTYSKRFFGSGYLHDANEEKGNKTLTFTPKVRKSGRYEVRLAYVPASNRATNVPVTVFSADGEVVVKVDQTVPPPIDGIFVSLGTYRFLDSGEGFVLVSNAGTDGHVVVDALQLLPDELSLQEMPETPVSAASPEQSAQRSALELALRSSEEELKHLRSTLEPRPRAMGVTETGAAADCPIHIRGNVHRLGDLAPRGFLQVATPPGTEAVFSPTESGRRQLGEWLSSPENPLTARVFVNRVWLWLFGNGLVRSVDNFGTTGDRPTHPELLDHLAVEFMAGKWSVKQLVRTLVTSHAYRLSSTPGTEAAGLDPENRLLSHANRRRLPAEAMRDTMLQVAGRLDSTAGGPTIAAGTATDYLYQHHGARRAVFEPAFRNSPVELLAAFDGADPSRVQGARHASTIAPQALYLMNHPFVREQCAAAAALWVALPGTVEQKVDQAYRSILGRHPSAGENAVARQFLADRSTGIDGTSSWEALFHALFSSADFRFVE